MIKDDVIMKSSLPTVEDLVAVYKELPKENVHILTFLLLFSGVYAASKDAKKSEILSFVSEEILASNFKKVRESLFFNTNYLLFSDE